MKRFILSFLFSLALLLPLGALDANIAFATFKSSSGPYLEVYLQVVGSTVGFEALPDSTVQARLEVVILFKQKGVIVKFDKYLLSSPVCRVPQDFFDVKRYSLQPGAYDIEVSVEDVNSPGNARRYEKSFTVGFPAGKVSQSDIQLLASLRKAKEAEGASPMVKGGYVFEPLPSHFLDKYSVRLIFYNEIYGTDQWLGEDFLVSYYLEARPGQRHSQPVNVVHRRRSPRQVVAILQQMDISQLPSGNYNLVIEVKNKSGRVLSRKSTPFQRSNPYLKASRQEIAAGTNSLNEEFVAEMSVEDLRYALRAIAMQVTDRDGELLNTIIAQGKPEAMRLYLFSFWARENPADPEGAYEKYMKVARAIDEKFRSGFGYGFETDRGYVYMKYGVPNDVVTVEDEQGAPPYEIWFYNEFPQTGQNNVKFLFYNPALSTNGYELLHSTARGELSNPQWEVQLYSSAPNERVDDNYVDGTRMQEKVGRHARRLFESF